MWNSPSCQDAKNRRNLNNVFENEQFLFNDNIHLDIERIKCSRISSKLKIAATICKLNVSSIDILYNRTVRQSQRDVTAEISSGNIVSHL